MGDKRSTEGYPKRPKFFAHRVVRLAFKACLAQEIGPVGALLVAFVAHTEDAKHYTAPPTFFNDQLIPVLGIRKWHTLDRARRDAVASGWLHYDAPPKGSRRPGVYWVLIPDRFETIDDLPSDEHYDRIREMDGESRNDSRQTANEANGQYTLNGEGRGYGMGEGRGEGRGYGMGELPTLSRIPVPECICKGDTPKVDLQAIQDICSPWWVHLRTNHPHKLPGDPQQQELALWQRFGGDLERLGKAIAFSISGNFQNVGEDNGEVRRRAASQPKQVETINPADYRGKR